MDGLGSRASMVRVSLHPLPASETSAFNKIRAFSTRRAGLFPFRIRVSSRSRSSPLSLTTYFFTEISFAAMIASLASRWRRKRITKSFQIGCGEGSFGVSAVELVTNGDQLSALEFVHAQAAPAFGRSDQRQRTLVLAWRARRMGGGGPWCG